MAQVTKINVRIYYDVDTDPNNPGYVVAWDTLAQTTLTAALDSEGRAAARQEAAELLGVEVDEVGWED